MDYTQEPLTPAQIEDLFNSTTALFPNPICNTTNRPFIKDAIEKRIEHTLLRPDSTTEDIIKLCETAQQFNFRAVCCAPKDTAICREYLKTTDLLIVTVIDFPLGMGRNEDVTRQCINVIDAGADEVDMVLNVRAIKSGDLLTAYEHINGVVKVAETKPVKVILETGYLTEEDIVKACAAARSAGAAFVKTSTGFGPRGASVRDISVMKRAVGNELAIKASGGIKTADFVRRLMDAGADVIGTSDGPGCIS